LTILKIIPSLLVIDTEGKRLELKVDEFQRKNKPGDASDSQVKHISIENERHKGGKTTRPVNKTTIAIFSVKGSSEPSHFLFEINYVKRQIRHRTTPKLNF